MDNVILVTFEDEGKAYEEFNRLKDNEATRRRRAPRIFEYRGARRSKESLPSSVTRALRGRARGFARIFCEGLRGDGRQGHR